MVKSRTLKNRLAAICMCLTVLCTTLFAGVMEVQAEDYWEAFSVKLTTKDTLKIGGKVIFKVAITNTTNKKLKVTSLSEIYYRDNENSEKYPGVDFGIFKDDRGKEIQYGNNGVVKGITFAAKETKIFTLTGKIPKTWGNKSAVTVVVWSETGKDSYGGQYDFQGKAVGTAAKITIKGTKLSNVRPAKRKATVRWKKQTKGTTGYQIQYSLKKNFKGAKVKNVSNNKKTSLTIKNLKSKKTYYVRIRTYKKKSGKNVFSAWSSAKKVKIK